MLSHVISIPYFIALHSTHAALQLPQSPLLPWRKNISFPANSYPLKRRKFHTLARGMISVYCPIVEAAATRKSIGLTL